MSIIYNALKKTQQQRAAPQNNKAKIYLAVIFLLIIILGFSIYDFYLFFSFPIRHIFASAPVQTSVPIKITLKLNGVYISGSRKIAMINQQFYALNSNINNMKIVEIDDNHIVLEDAKKRREILALTTLG